MRPHEGARTRIVFGRGFHQLEILGFKSGGLVDLVVQCPSQIGQLENEFAELKKWPANMSCREMSSKQCITRSAATEP